jgi:hypothetical protein
MRTLALLLALAVLAGCSDRPDPRCGHVNAWQPDYVPAACPQPPVED